MLASGEDIDFVGHDDIDKAGHGEELPPLCFQQSTGNSATPEVDVVLGVLGDFAVDEDIAHLQTAGPTSAAAAPPAPTDTALPPLGWEDAVALLDTIPGVGRGVAELIIAEIGTDIPRPR